jgi:Zn-dependent protease
MQSAVSTILQLAGENPLEFWSAVVIGALAHELGHLFFALLLGVRVKHIGLSWMGPYIERADGTPHENIVIALAGPGVNLLLATVGVFGLPLFAAVNIALALINLLPTVRSSDGHRVVVNLKRIMVWRETA